MAVSAWFPAACNPWLRVWPLTEPAHLSAFLPVLLVLHGAAKSFSALRRRSSPSPEIAGATLLPLAILASEHCCGPMQGCQFTKLLAWFNVCSAKAIWML